MLHCLKIFLAFLLLGSCFCTASAQQPGLPTPPGTIKFQEKLYIDKTELANIHWVEFLHHIRRDSGEAYFKKMLPDTLVWAQRNLPNPQVTSDSLSKAYFTAAEYQYFPLVGINYEQAQAYARWRSAVVSQGMNEPEALDKLGLAGKRIRVEYRLPMEEEWMAAAAANLNLDEFTYGIKKWEQKLPKSLDPRQAYDQLAEPKPPYKQFKKEFKRAKLPLFQVVAQLPSNILVAPEFPKAIHEGPANALGIVNAIGNVAEMTSAPGIAKGGSFMHLMQDAKITDRQQYYGPAPWLGVRYVAEVFIFEF